MDEERSRWPGRIGLAIAITIAAVWSFIYLPDAIKQFAPDLRAGIYAGLAGAIIGHVAFITIPTFLILYFFFLRDWESARPSRYFATLVFAVIALDAGLVAVGKVYADRKAAEFAEVRTELRQLFVLAKSSYHVAGDTSLAASHGIDDARTRIAAARALVKRSREAEEKVLADTRSAIARAPMAELSKQQMLVGFDKSSQESSRADEGIWDCEDAILAETDKMVLDLKNSDSAWKPQGGKFVFSSQRDLDRFREHQQQIRQLAASERAIAAQAQARALADFNAGVAQSN